MAGKYEDVVLGVINSGCGAGAVSVVGRRPFLKDDIVQGGKEIPVL